MFSRGEVATLLLALAHGRSMRSAARDMRRSAHRTVLFAWGLQRPSPHGQLAADYVAALGQALVAELMPDRWPDAVALERRHSRYD